MPLKKSCTPKNVSSNIREMRHAGHPQNVSVAAAPRRGLPEAEKGRTQKGLMALLADLDLIADRATRAARIVRTAQAARLAVNEGDADLELQLTPAQKQSIRDRATGMFAEIKDAAARLP